MRQVTTISKTHSQHGVAGLEQSVVNRDVGARTRVRLNIGIVCTKQCFGSLNGEHLGTVDKLTATVVALTRITLSVLIGQHRPLGFEDSWTRVVFRRNELDVLFLALRFKTHRIPQFAIKTLYRLRCVVAVLHGRLSSLVHT